MKIICLLITLLASSLSGITIHYWNFNENIPDSSTNWSNPLPANSGNGMLSYEFTQAYSYSGTNLNGLTGEIAGGSFCPRGGATINDIPENNGRYFELSVSTQGYTDISLYYATRSTSTGFTSQSVSYSIDGIVYEDIANFDTPLENSWSQQQIMYVNFADIPEVNNNPNFRIRITLDGATAGTGNNRFDNIRVTSDEIQPAPRLLVHYWNFNENIPPSSTNWTQPIPATNGEGTLTYQFTQAYSYAGTTINGINGDVNGGSFVPRGGEVFYNNPENNGRYFQLDVSTRGYTDIALSYATQSTSTGFTSQSISYSTDGISYTNLLTFNEPLENVWTPDQVKTIDFSQIQGVNDNPNFKIRITLNGATGHTGNNRFDNFKITARNLDPPINLTYMLNGNSVRLNWNPPPDSGNLEIHYNVCRDGFTLNQFPIAETTYTDSGLLVGETYAYYITAVYNVGISEPSNSVTVSVPYPVMTPPQNLQCILYTNSVFLEWEAPVEEFRNRAYGYNVYRNNNLLNQNAILTRHFWDDNIQINEEYLYFVTALYPWGESEASNEVLVSTLSINSNDLVSSPSLQFYPTPCSSVLFISLAEKEESPIFIYNLKGQLIIKISAQTTDTIKWDLKDDSGKNVGNGIYFLKADHNGKSIIRKFSVIR